MDPAICIEAEQARLSEHVARAKEHVSEGLRRLAEQSEVVEKLERHGRPAATAMRVLGTLVATQRLAEADYEHLLRRLTSYDDGHVGVGL